jgi:hypothetical protein
VPEEVVQLPLLAAAAALARPEAPKAALFPRRAEAVAGPVAREVLAEAVRSHPRRAAATRLPLPPAAMAAQPQPEEAAEEEPLLRQAAACRRHEEQAAAETQLRHPLPRFPRPEPEAP